MTKKLGYTDSLEMVEMVELVEMGQTNNLQMTSMTF